MRLLQPLCVAIMMLHVRGASLACYVQYSTWFWRLKQGSGHVAHPHPWLLLLLLHLHGHTDHVNVLIIQKSDDLMMMLLQSS